MGVPFDHIASAYDSVFAQSAIGQLQRKRVWKYIESVIPQLNGIEMLELNCGTGEEADLFSEKGFNIVATDISQEMLKITDQKARQYSMQHRISSQYLDLDSLNETLFDKKFDLVFSNFGGLNCIDPDSLKILLGKLPMILKPGGRFIGVIMPKFCAWETANFLVRFKFKKAFRRLTSKEVINQLQGIPVKTWYYQPTQIKRWTKNIFNVVAVKPVGFALPASFFEEFFSRHNTLLSFFNRIEKRVNEISVFSGMSDHYIIDLQIKPQ
jgi:ubiquinone/menaquinone biosynthesis C-methylase UbiE